MLSMRPLSEADLAGAGDRDDDLRAQTSGAACAITGRSRDPEPLPRRRLAGRGGAYFWPAWVMLGSAVAIGIKALPRPARAHAHLLGDHS